MSGLNRISEAFERAQTSQTAALMPYFTLGYPNREASIDAIEAIAEHSDLLELGVPFSDPIADGPTVQRSTQISLDAGTTMKGCLDMVRELRRRGVDTPAMLMGYYNPILAYGMEKFIADAKEAGVDGFIVPDLPPEESAELDALAVENDLAYIYFLAPTSNEERIKTVTERAKGFIYMVSVAGVTGARTQVREGLDEFVSRVREQADAPVAVGFGISSPDQASNVGAFADGVIVGSALLNAHDADGESGAADFVSSLKDALHKDTAE